VNGRSVVSTSLGSLVLDSGAHYMIRFGVRGTEDNREIVSTTGSVRAGTIFSRLDIQSRTFWRGEAVAVPESPETGVQGLLPISPFKSIYVSNSENYVVVD